MRTRINDRLARAAAFPVAFVVAPAGFGKSVALRDFLEASHREAIRLDLRREDATLLDFVRRLSEALAPVAPTAAASFPALVTRIMSVSQPVRELSDWFVEHTKDVAATIVIDDLHYAAADTAAVAFLADVIERTSDRISWIISSRNDAGLPLATWVAYGRMDLAVGEDDLRFTPEEALAAAGEAGAAIDASEVESLRDLTRGWPVAFNIALRTRTHVRDLQSAASGTRDIVYRYLAEQTIAGLAPDQRQLLEATCVFSTFDADIVARLNVSAEAFDTLRRSGTFLSETSTGEYRYHDLFRDFLENQLLRSGRERWLQALRSGGAILEQRGDDAGALQLFTRAADADSLVRILERSGLPLFERGSGEMLRTAIDAVPDQRQSSSAAIQGLRAMLEAARGHFEVAEPRFVLAIRSASDPNLRMNLVHRYAVESVRFGRDCIAFLEPHARDDRLAGNLRLPILGTLATAYAGAGRFADAENAIERALKLLDADTSEETRARLLQQTAYVYQFTDTSRARKYAEMAIEASLARNLYDVAARGCSVLYALLYNETADPVRLLEILEKLIEYARKGGSEQTRLYGLIASYDLQIELGEESALDEIERELEQSHAALPLASSEMLVPARALRYTWSGNFERAFALVSEVASEQRTDERRAVADALAALCAFAAGLPAEGDRFVRDANAALEKSPPSMQSNRARLFLAIAEMQRGRSREAHRHIAAAEHVLTPAMRQLRAFAQAARVAYRANLAQSEDGAWGAALERLRESHFGGIARMLEALPAAGAQAEGYSALTPAERDILRLLAGGASSKEVGAKTGRSPQTVDTHIRSICRKLGCSGRREAVALATSSGWVET